jgi:2-C-methyl-D-erythritol 4-phosphate cytidylyltransferase
MKISALIPAAGSGERFGGKKQLKILGNRPLLFHTLRPFMELDLISEIVVVAPKEEVLQLDQQLKSTISTKAVKVVAGGKTRQDSVYNGLIATNKSHELI